MKIIYEDIVQTSYHSYKDIPWRYRVTLSIVGDDILMKKETFKTGFVSGEHDDEIFIGNHNNNNDPDILYISIMTKNIGDEKYLKSFEKLLIDKYVKECQRIIPELNDKLQQQIKHTNNRINELNKTLKFLSNFDRREKIKKINYEKKNI